MKNSSDSKLKSLFQLNWFTILVFIVLAFIFVRKDLSLNFNLNAPMKVEKEASPKREAPSQKIATPRKKREGKLTEKAPTQKVAEKSEAGTSFFNFFSRGSAKKKGKNLLAPLDEIDASFKEAYLKRFAHVAKEEQEKFGIPTSIILANALLHSQAGQSNLVRNYNNQFAIPCGENWVGGTGSDNGVCYRTYESAWMSFRNHSRYITTGKFAHLKDLGAQDYRAWAKGLEKANFSEDGNLAKNLILIIEKYGLNDLDS